MKNKIPKIIAGIFKWGSLLRSQLGYTTGVHAVRTGQCFI